MRMMNVGISCKGSKTSSENKIRGEPIHDRRVSNKSKENLHTGLLIEAQRVFQMILSWV